MLGKYGGLRKIHTYYKSLRRNKIMASERVNLAMVTPSDLERMLSTSIFNNQEYADKLTKYLVDGITTNGDVRISTLQCVSNLLGLEDYFVSVYNKFMAMDKNADNIPNSVKMSQGALFDGLCFAYEIKTGKFNLFTMNYRVLSLLGIDGVDMTKQVMTKNKAGLAKGYKIDVEYQNGPGKFTFKAVNARLNIDDPLEDNSPEKEVYLVPLKVVTLAMSIIETFLYSNRVIKTVQEHDGVEKVRFITLNKKTLAAYCDDPTAVQSLEPKFFPLKAFFYAPVIGAPSTTAMVTNINLFNLVTLSGTSPSELAKNNVTKPENPLRDIFRTQVISNSLIVAKEKQEAKGTPEKMEAALANFPERERLGSIDSLNPTVISSYLHSLSEEDLSKIETITKSKTKVNKLTGILLEEPRQMTAEELKDLKGTLKNHLCRILVQKKDCTLSSITGTNNPNILVDIYGDNYFRRFEAFSSRFYAFIDSIMQSRNMELTNVQKVLRTFGFHYNKKLAGALIDQWENQVVGPQGFDADDDIKKVWINRAKYILAEDEGISLKASESSSNNSSKSEDSNQVMVRTFGGYIDPVKKKPVNFYRMVDPSKIISASILA